MLDMVCEPMLPMPLPLARGPSCLPSFNGLVAPPKRRSEPPAPLKRRIDAPTRAPSSGKRARGKLSYLAGLAAEDQVAQDYARRGHRVAARRWRGAGGEIDIIARDGDRLIVVEVKQARSFDQALAHVTEAQVARIASVASEFVAHEPRGSMTDLRFDVALVDEMGRIEILENFWA